LLSLNGSNQAHDDKTNHSRLAGANAMKKGRRMRTSRKLRRVYTFTILAWLMAIFVFWAIGAMHYVTGINSDEFLTDSEMLGRYIIYSISMIFGLLALLLAEFLVLRAISKIQRKSQPPNKVKYHEQAAEPKLSRNERPALHAQSARDEEDLI
jgi:FtsH-binding integral membrane protein